MDPGIEPHFLRMHAAANVTATGELVPGRELRRGGLLSLRLLLAVFVCVILGAVTDANAQSAPRKRVGVIFNSPPMSDFQPGTPLTNVYALAIQEEIVKAGWHPGRNVEILWRSAENDFSRYPAIVDELVSHRVDVIVVGQNDLADLTRKKAPTTPIVMIGGNDLVKNGLVATLARPGGTITGVEVYPSSELLMKRIAVLREAVPGITRLGYLCCIGYKREREWGEALLGEGPTALNPTGRRSEIWENPELRDVAMLAYELQSIEEIDAAVAHAARRQVQALVIDRCGACYRPDVQARIHEALAKHRLPAIGHWLDAVERGWMIGYSAEPRLQFGRAGYYVGRILNGARAADLPIERLGDFKLYINRKTARAIGVTFPDSLLLRADKIYD